MTASVVVEWKMIPSTSSFFVFVFVQISLMLSVTEPLLSNDLVLIQDFCKHGAGKWCREISGVLLVCWIDFSCDKQLSQGCKGWIFVTYIFVSSLMLIETDINIYLNIVPAIKAILMLNNPKGTWCLCSFRSVMQAPDRVRKWKSVMSVNYHVSLSFLIN